MNEFQNAMVKGQQALQLEAKTHQKLDEEVKALLAPKQRYLTQIAENEAVAEELGLCEETSGVYKLVGPALIKQEKNMAVDTVRQRLEFMHAKVKELDQQIEAKVDALQKSKQKFMQLQTMIRQTRDEFQAQQQASQIQQAQQVKEQ